MRQGHAINALIAVMDHNMILVVKIRDLPVITGALHHFSDQHLAITTPASAPRELAHHPRFSNFKKGIKNWL